MFSCLIFDLWGYWLVEKMVLVSLDFFKLVGFGHLTWVVVSWCFGFASRVGTFPVCLLWRPLVWWLSALNGLSFWSIMFCMGWFGPLLVWCFGCPSRVSIFPSSLSVSVLWFSLLVSTFPVCLLWKKPFVEGGLLLVEKMVLVSLDFLKLVGFGSLTWAVVFCCFPFLSLTFGVTGWLKGGSG